MKSEYLTSFDEHLEQRYGPVGSEKRTQFDINAKAFALGEIIREERRLSKLTQQQLADKVGTGKSFISRVENGHGNITLSALYRLIETGLGKRISFTVS